MLETRLLYYFLAIAREQSITKAAESLHISQPSLSKQMMDLEDQLGKPLFIRGSRKITLTEDGAYLRSHAQEIIELLERTETTLMSGDSLIEGDICIGCAETPVMKWVLHVFKRLQAEYPGIRLHIYSGNADTVIEKLNKGLLDIGLLLAPMQQDKYDYLPLHHEDIYGLLMPADSPLAAKDVLSPSDLLGLPLIFPSQTLGEGLEIAWFGSDAHKVHTVATYNLIYNAAFMAEEGLGYVVCLDRLVSLTPDRNLAFRPIAPVQTAKAYIVTKKYQTFSAAAKLFLDRIEEELEQHPDSSQSHIQ